MTDKKNIVIKVKYLKSGKAKPGKAAEEFTPKIITEWNVKRILIAVGVLIVVVAVLAYIIIEDSDENAPGNSESSASTVEKELALPPEVRETEIKKTDIPRPIAAKTSPLIKPQKEADKKDKSTGDIDIAGKKVIKKQSDPKAVKGYSKDRHNVIRAVLSYDINNKGPKGEVPKTVFLNGKKPISVYYFTELKSVGNNKAYHEWLKDGMTVSKQELAISGDTSRTSSHRLLTNSAKGNWVVRLVDGHGRLLNEKKFKVE